MKVFQNILCIALLGCRSFGQEASPKLHVRNAKAAIEIGKAELIRRYGRQVINSEQPISAKLEDRTWTVNTPQWCQEMLPAQGFYCHGCESPATTGASLRQELTPTWRSDDDVLDASSCR